MNEDAVARIADGFWVDVRGTDTPDDMMEALATVLAQALSLYCATCRKDAIADLHRRLPEILAEADRIAAEPLVMSN